MDGLRLDLEFTGQRRLSARLGDGVEECRLGRLYFGFRHRAVEGSKDALQEQERRVKNNFKKGLTRWPSYLKMQFHGRRCAYRKRQKETKMNISEWFEYATMKADDAREAMYAAMNVCPSCEGCGDHGVEEDTGCLFTCYGCDGTGRFHNEVAA